MAKRIAQKLWMRVLNNDDATQLSKILVSKHLEWSDWQYKVFLGNVVIYVPVTPWNPKTHKPDPSMRYMARQWRVVPEPGGPFQLEYMRHTGKWWPMFDAVGSLEEIAKHIAEDAKHLSSAV
ncbi:MAG: hypothetical protein HY287_10670 [Planctomycetes bacterium]|nr:hypothetical protein [Planctomycetota bacterium]MBI3834781.1 hypothetical protein [Planctomycetota bacterium]